MAEYNKERRWAVPNKRAKGYADERKAKVHMHGQKEGKELTSYEAGLRSGYLQCQSDHAGLFRYKDALNNGLSKEEADIHLYKTLNQSRSINIFLSQNRIGNKLNQNNIFESCSKYRFLNFLILNLFAVFVFFY